MNYKKKNIKPYLFSIVMPNYNNSNYIKEAINSVLNQTYENWELIIVDDSSTDNSIKIIEKFLKDKRIKLIKLKRNKGVSFVSNIAIDNSSGDLIGILDSDDVLNENALEIMEKTHRDNPEYGLIYSGHYKCDQNLEVMNTFNVLEKIPSGKSLQEMIQVRPLTRPRPSIHFRTFKRKAYDQTKGFDIYQKIYNDRDIYYQLEKITKIKGVNIPLYYWRHHNAPGLFRNPQDKVYQTYYRFLCEYREIERRFNISLPFSNKKKFSPFLINIMYFYLKKYMKNVPTKSMKSLFFDEGYIKRTSNKRQALSYYLNSLLYGFDTKTLKAIFKLFIPGYYKNEEK